jgi:hypothetical protein
MDTNKYTPGLRRSQTRQTSRGVYRGNLTEIAGSGARRDFSGANDIPAAASVAVHSRARLRPFAAPCRIAGAGIEDWIVGALVSVGNGPSRPPSDQHGRLPTTCPMLGSVHVLEGAINVTQKEARGKNK